MSTQKPASSPWSFRIATVSGIPVRIHITFFLLVAWVIFAAQSSPEGMTLAILLPFVFLSVILHELGHALTARRFGVGTRDITLYPIGGVAMLTDRPKPKQEFWIALAGPMVNVVIAVVVGLLLWLTTGSLPQVFAPLKEHSVLEGIFAVNVILPLFNMVPAFPMDGGRVLRSVLAMQMPEAKATQIAAVVGQLLAVGFGMLGIITGNVVLVLIAVFVFLGAGQEAQSAVGMSLIEGRRIADAMLTNFRTLSGGQTLEEASSLLLEGSQQDFPVSYEGTVHGVLTRDALLRGLAQRGGSDYVAGHMVREFSQFPPHEPLESALKVFSQGDKSPILVMENDELIGMLTIENLYEFMMLQQARAKG